MVENFYINGYCHIKNSKIFKDGNLLFEIEETDFSKFSKLAYTHLLIAYSKFFKMDALSKLAFLAAEIILKNGDDSANTALVFANKTSSLDTDRKHQATIDNEASYYPSPSVFVYTLPNICLGEISIKHNLHSENSFFIFNSFNAEALHTYTNSLLKRKKAENVVCGWVEYNGINYNAFLYLVGRKGKFDHTTEEIKTLYNLI